LVLKILVVLPNLETKEHVSSLLILRKICPTFDKHPLKGLEVWTYEKRLMVLWNGYHNHWWLSYPLSRLHRSNSDVIIVEDHLKLVEGMHTFSLDLTLLDLEVCSFTSIFLKVSTRSAQNLPMQWG
jgi:hypothetical protein